MKSEGAVICAQAAKLHKMWTAYYPPPTRAGDLLYYTSAKTHGGARDTQGYSPIGCTMFRSISFAPVQNRHFALDICDVSLS